MRTDSNGTVNVNTEALITLDLEMPSKKKVMFNVIIKIPMAINLGQSLLAILVFLL